jgi:RNA polymerase-interacting CarD/CdnL/TRCF family regulator
MTKKQKFSKGDWIVHVDHGVGKVKGIERKRLGGEKSKYFRVETNDRIYWIPVDDVDECQVRPIASSTVLRKALKVLRKPARQMESDYKKRLQRIKKARMEGSLLAICKLMRDLIGRQREKSLNDHERRALQFAKNLLLEEWSISADLPIDEARVELQKILKENGTPTVKAA